MTQEVCTGSGWQLIDLTLDKGVSAFKVEGENGELAANMHRGNRGALLKRVEDGLIKRGSVLIIARLSGSRRELGRCRWGQPGQKMPSQIRLAFARSVW